MTRMRAALTLTTDGVDRARPRKTRTPLARSRSRGATRTPRDAACKCATHRRGSHAQPLGRLRVPSCPRRFCCLFATAGVKTVGLDPVSNVSFDGHRLGDTARFVHADPCLAAVRRTNFYSKASLRESVMVTKERFLERRRLPRSGSHLLGGLGTNARATGESRPVRNRNSNDGERNGRNCALTLSMRRMRSLLDCSVRSFFWRAKEYRP